jgi:diguanylate cyclase (GGDEF)-like protein
MGMSLAVHSPAVPVLADALGDRLIGDGAERDREALLSWALDRLAAADQQVADLNERLAYLESLSVTDELTRLLNRRGFLGELTRALSWARRGGTGGVLMIGDLDGFKGVNDLHGHAAGNYVLREVAGRMLSQLRRCDAAGRLGGDEFAFLLVGANLTGAKSKARSLARSLEALNLSFSGTPIVVSASFGFALYDGSEDEEILLHRADMAMYEAKRGRHAKLRAVG